MKKTHIPCVGESTPLVTASVSVVAVIATAAAAVVISVAVW